MAGAITLERILALQAAYIRCIDDNALEAWPDFFLDQCLYIVTTAENRRGPLFYLLLPVMCLYAAVSVPVCLLLSLGDLSEEPNNHLVVARKSYDVSR